MAERRLAETYEYGWLYVMQVTTGNPDPGVWESVNVYVLLTAAGTRHAVTDSILALKNELGADGWLLDNGSSFSNVPAWLKEIGANYSNHPVAIYDTYHLRKRWMVEP